MEALGLDATEIRVRDRWPLGSLLRTIGEQLAGRFGVPAGGLATAAPDDPEREFVLRLAPSAPMQASCELAASLVSAVATGADPQPHDRLRAMLDDFDGRHPPLIPRVAALVAACRQRDIPWRPIAGWAGYLQLGEGALQVRTDRVSSTGDSAIQLASDKTTAFRLLHRHGIPVAAHIATTDPGRAWEMAQNVGLPVVVKPAGRTGAPRCPSA